MAKLSRIIEIEGEKCTVTGDTEEELMIDEQCARYFYKKYSRGALFAHSDAINSLMETIKKINRRYSSELLKGPFKFPDLTREEPEPEIDEDEDAEFDEDERIREEEECDDDYEDDDEDAEHAEAMKSAIIYGKKILKKMGESEELRDLVKSLEGKTEFGKEDLDILDEIKKIVKEK